MPEIHRPAAADRAPGSRPARRPTPESSASAGRASTEQALKLADSPTETTRSSRAPAIQMQRGQAASSRSEPVGGFAVEDLVDQADELPASISGSTSSSVSSALVGDLWREGLWCRWPHRRGHGTGTSYSERSDQLQEHEQPEAMQDRRPPRERSSQARDQQCQHGRRDGVAQTCAIERLHGRFPFVIPWSPDLFARRSTTLLAVELLDQGAKLRCALARTALALRPGESAAARASRRTASRQQPAGAGRSARRG